jgi:acyl homoserine lactone synthase
MHRLRYEVFHDRLGWDVQPSADRLEIDVFDSLDRVHYIVAKSPHGHIDACWRLLPSLGPYMLKDIFSNLLHGQVAPAASDVWELSRFAISAGRVETDEKAVNHQIGFGELSVALMAEAASFARANGISRYVTVTTTAIERLMLRQGLHIHRLGSPIRIGRVMTVACFIEVDSMTLDAVGYSDESSGQPPVLAG